MIDLFNEITELSKMSRDIRPEILEELGGPRGNYAKRLGAVAQKSFQRSDLLRGTTIQNPSYMHINKKGRLSVGTPDKRFAMYIREIEVEEGFFVSFPLRTVGLSVEKVPVIDTPLDSGNHTIAYLPKKEFGNYPVNTGIPSEMKASFVFNVDGEDFVTKNFLSAVTPAEYALFDSVVCEFERRVEG